MKFEKTNKNGWTVYSFEGAMTAEYEFVLTPIIRHEEAAVIFEMSLVDFLDSFGVAFLVRIYRRLAETEGQFRLAGLTDDSMDLLKLSRVLHCFDVYPNLEMAIEG